MKCAISLKLAGDLALIKDASNSIFTKKSHMEGFLKSGHISSRIWGEAKVAEDEDDYCCTDILWNYIFHMQKVESNVLKFDNLLAAQGESPSIICCCTPSWHPQVRFSPPDATRLSPGYFFPGRIALCLKR